MSGRFILVAMMIGVVMAFFLGASPTRAALIVTAMGVDTTTQDNWRTTTTIKPFDSDGDNVYGYTASDPADSGYYAFGPGSPFGPGGGGGGTGLSPYDLNGLPTWLTLTATGANHFYTGGYPLIDDPRLAPGPLVSDINSGISYATGVSANTETSLFKLTFDTATPANAFRIGLMNNGSTDPVTQFTLSAYTSANVLISTDTQPFAGSGVSYTFFDVSGAVAGDYLVISGQTAGGAGNFSLSGITIDVVPEPASLSLIGGVILLASRRRRA